MGDSPESGFIQNKIATQNKSAVINEAPPFPRLLMMEPTNACNLQCVFCPAQKQTKKKTFIPTERAREIMGDAYAAGAREIGFYLTGEPFLHPNFTDLIKTAADVGYEYIFTDTNGILATPERLEQAARSGLHSIKFSINAGSPEAYLKVHGADAFDTVMDNLRAAIRIRDAKNGSLRLVMMSSVYTGSPDPKLLQFHKNFAADLNDIDLVEECEYFDITGKFGQVCTEPFHRACVNSGGGLTVCSYDFQNVLEISTLENETIEEAWTGELFRQFRQRFISRDLSGTMCGRCLYGDTAKVHPLLHS